MYFSLAQGTPLMHLLEVFELCFFEVFLFWGEDRLALPPLANRTDPISPQTKKKQKNVGSFAESFKNLALSAFASN